jgi:hypothetical protein
MITGVHGLIYTPAADEVRAFFRDVLEFPSVDAGGGWLIFALPPAELGVHPAEVNAHKLYLMCDDIEATRAELRDKGVQFSGPIEDQGFGRVATIALPGGGKLALYEPRHPTAVDLPDGTDPS